MNHWELSIIIYLSNRVLFPYLYSLIKTQGGLGEFVTVMQTLYYVSDLHNFQEFSQPSKCLDEAI